MLVLRTMPRRRVIVGAIGWAGMIIMSGPGAPRVVGLARYVVVS